jgi:hypothetical protein
MQTIKYHEDELDNIFIEIQKDLSELKKSPSLPSKIDLLKKRIEEAKEVFQNYKIAFFHLPKKDRANNDIKLKDHGETLNRLISEFNWHPSRM